MEELVRTNDVVMISYIETMLKDQEINHLILDQHMSVLEGSIGMIQRRIMVESTSLHQARRLLKELGLEKELPELNNS
ncbi:MAG: hypothetical protein COC17_06355 [Hyphomicrobiales bacterium]|nr:DUF2007 domain-containing protein [Hyphomicrobiales bacterium]PCH50008.1 MAG: hypothetical protein COC17_06355 [Hyphomicrobiales bacterium]